MDPITGLGAATQSSSSRVNSPAGSNVNKQQFLDLLATQLQNQNPLEPMKNEDFLAQLATFSQLEEQQATNATLGQLLQMQAASLTLGSLAQGAALIGKEVRYVDANAQPQAGLVEGISFEPEGVILTVNGQRVSLGSVTAVNTATAPDPQTTPTTTPTPTTALPPTTDAQPAAAEG